MLFKRDPYFYYRRFFHTPDDPAPDGGGGGDDSPPADPPEPPEQKPKTFSEKEVNAREAGLRRRYDREIKELKHKTSARDSEFEALKAKIAELEGGGDPPPSEPRDTEGRIELLEKRFARTEADLNNKIQAAEKAAAEERQRRLDLEREQQLQDALAAAGIEDSKKKAASRFFSPQIEWDPIDECWAYKTESGNLVSVIDGVSEELPDLFKPSKLKRGGSGSSSGSPGVRVRKHKELEAEEKKLEEVKEKVRQAGGRPGAMLEFTKQKRKVESLRAELSSK